MEKETLFKIAAWGTIIVGILVVTGAFDPAITYYGDFYLYLVLISGIIGIIGAIISLGIFSILGGIAISGGMMFLSFQYGFNTAILWAFLKGILLVIGGSGIILTFEVPEYILSTDLSRLEIGKKEYFELKTVGIHNLEELVEEKGREEEICSILSISVPQLKKWIQEAEQILQKTEELKKTQLEKDYKKKHKK